MLTSTVEEEVGDDSLKEYNYKLYHLYVVFCTVYGHLVQLTSTTTTTVLL